MCCLLLLTAPSGGYIRDTSHVTTLTFHRENFLNRCRLSLSAPAAVSEVTVANGGRSDALRVSWRPAVGVADSYLVRLQDGSRTVHTLAVSRSSPPECSFSSLVAGRLYSVVIVTRSGSLENATTVQTRTREDGS